MRPCHIFLFQGIERFSDIAIATGSGGSTAGLAIANYLTKSNLQIHGMMVCDGPRYFSDHIDDTLKEIGLWDTGLTSNDIVDLVDGVKGQGYGVSTQEELGKYSIFTVAFYLPYLLNPHVLSASM